MGPYVHEWANLLIRWAHIVAAIMWIGDSLFFMWLDSHLTKVPGAKKGVEGELWMVHSGGFYQVEKKLVVPEEMPKKLYWFKWEATSTWITGFLLLLVVYYFGGALTAPGESFGRAAAIGLGALPVAWIAYDAFFESRLGKINAVAIPVAVAAVIGTSYFLSVELSGRAAYIHVGALFGTLMVLNVWFRILPSQRALIAATEKGTTPDPLLAASAKRRSVHNNYMTFPVIFIMISNHFPATTYGYHFGMLIACMGAGAGVRYWFNTRTPRSIVVASAATLAMFAGAFALFPEREVIEVQSPPPPAKALLDYASIDASKLSAVEGEVRFAGPPPVREVLSMSEAVCAAAHREPMLSETAIVEGGAVANAFVHVKEGLDGYRFPPVQGEVVVDQIGCRYVPHVVGARVGQTVTFVNSDDTTHNVHTVPVKNKSANFAMPTKGQRIGKQLAKPEVMIKTQCDIHPWMSAYLGVVGHPFFQVTGPDGRFSLEGLPAGSYVIEVWHERFGRKEKAIQIGEQAKESVSFTYEEGDHG